MRRSTCHLGRSCYNPPASTPLCPIPLEAKLSIRQRGVALMAALTIVGAVLIGTMSAASAQNYQPSTQPSSSVAPSSGSQSSTTAALPRTGSNSTVPMTQLGVLLVVGGGFLV